MILLLGASGGGHMALVMAAFRPTLWRMVSSWVPITDLAAWHRESPGYAPGMEACCGGTPSAAPEEYRARSPITHVAEIAKAHVSIHHGKRDPSVPFTHSLNLYNAVMAHGRDARVYLSIFDGGHELRYPEAFAELQRALRSSEGTPVTG